MTDKEKLKKIKCWVEKQIAENDKRRIKAQKEMNHLKAMQEMMIGSFYWKVLNKIEEIEKAD